MKNKRLAIFLIIFVFLAVFVVLSSTIFSLRKVEVRFMSSTNVLTNTEEAMIESGQFRYGENMFLLSKRTYTSNLEKNNPYLKVVNLETIFPNKLIINAVERNECYVIKLSNNKYAVVDEEMKVLKILDVYQNTNSNAIQVFNSGLAEQSVEAGDFFTLEDDYFKVLFDSFREWKISYADVKAKITSIELNYQKEDQLLIVMRSGVKILVQKSKHQLSDKLNLAFSFYDQTTDKNGNPVDNTKSGTILIAETEDKIYGLYNPND